MKKWFYCRFCQKFSYMYETTVQICPHCGKDITYPNDTMIEIEEEQRAIKRQRYQPSVVVHGMVKPMSCPLCPFSLRATNDSVICRQTNKTIFDYDEVPDYCPIEMVYEFKKEEQNESKN